MTPLRRRMIEDMRLRNRAPAPSRPKSSRVAGFRHFGTSPEHIRATCSISSIAATSPGATLTRAYPPSAPLHTG